MNKPTSIHVPGLVRIKPNALDRLGIYLRRRGHGRVLVLASSDLPASVCASAKDGLVRENLDIAAWIDIRTNAFEDITDIFAAMTRDTDAVIGLGGGKALDMAKYLAFLARLAYFAVPTSLSNDGFCSPQSSLTIKGRRRSLAATLPQGVIIDVTVCLQAPRVLWLSGVGDLASKLSAVHDWKMAFHQRGEPVEDLAALLSDATVRQFLAQPTFDVQGMTLLGTALMLNGIAMEICGSSRPASGSEHLISHALDATSARPRLHGLQVGVATYIACRLQGQQSETVAELFQTTGFWDAIRSDPFSRAEWLDAARQARTIKKDFFTVLSTRDCVPEISSIVDTDPVLTGCFR